METTTEKKPFTISKRGLKKNSTKVLPKCTALSLFQKPDGLWCVATISIGHQGQVTDVKYSEGDTKHLARYEFRSLAAKLFMTNEWATSP